MKKSFNSFGIMLGSLLIPCCVALNANAAFQITLAVGASQLTLTDEVAGDQSLGTPGIISFNGSFAGYNFNFVGSASNTPGAFDTATLRIGTLLVEDVTGGAALVRLVASATGYNDPTAPPQAFGISSASASSSGNTEVLASFKAFADQGNTNKTAAGGSIQLANTAPVALSGGATATPAGGIQVPINVLNAGYDLSLEILLNFQASGGKVNTGAFTEIAGPESIDFPLPEPASMAIWGLGAAAMAFAGARRRKLTA